VADPFNVAVTGASPIAGEALAPADSGPIEMIVKPLGLAVAPLASVTVRLAVYAPAAYV
jgi:hypothetical protein